MEALEKFANDLLDGKLEPYMKSEPVPTSQEAVKVCNVLMIVQSLLYKLFTMERRSFLQSLSHTIVIAIILCFNNLQDAL